MTWRKVVKLEKVYGKGVSWIYFMYFKKGSLLLSDSGDYARTFSSNIRSGLNFLLSFCSFAIEVHSLFANSCNKMKGLSS